MANELGSRERVLSILALLTLGFSILLFRSGYLQVVKHGHYARLSQQNRLRRLCIPAPRGLVFDCNGVLIAQSRPGFDLVLVTVNDWQASVNKAAGLLGLDSLLLKSSVILQRKIFPKDPVVLVRDLMPEQVARIEENIQYLPALRLEVESLRKAEHGSLASHLVGYTSSLGQSEYARYRERGYSYGDYIGKGGLELKYENYLRGVHGWDFIEVDARGRDLGTVSEAERIEPDPGSNIYLTIDWRLQSLAESLFTGDMIGAAVAIEPQTGRVLALVSRPNFNPNLFAAGIRSDDWNRLVNDPSYPLWDRAIRSAYPPGSTFKVVTAAAALEESLITPEQKMKTPCRGSLAIGNRVFKCWKKGGHGWLGLHGAIVNSCDVYFYQLGIMLKIKGLSKWSQNLGFNQETGIDLPQENPGLIPDDAWYQKRLGKNAKTVGRSANMSIGQGEVMATPLQMASLYAALANGGVWCQPHLLLKAEDFTGKVLVGEIISRKKLPLSDSTVSVLKQALYGAVNEPGSTGGASRVWGVKTAGKTGTAQNPHGDDHSWFVGFAPLDDPAIAVAVLVENAGHGSEIAAPMAGKIMQRYLALKGWLEKPVIATARPQ
ncbi:penicillin-binding protein 2 [candidate division TA06 bacterium]|uniref:Penicillin-binding protein 2 n=1 Tax=candidate division TA06 bacterium TaxID=2250710 RepID=A0A933IBR7_UNCT6|nr:penicillin-binding protein 2 [candidate division TA06 bacterium]